MQNRLLFFPLLCLALLFAQCKKASPVPFEEDEGEGGKMKLREQFLTLQHRAAPGIDWKRANESVMVQDYLQQAAALSPAKSAGTFANGKIKAAWFERGSLNQAGSVIAIDYVPSSDQIYTISAGGTLWRGALSGNNWTELNRNLRFNTDILQVFSKPGGGQRILTAIGKKIWYSDDEGASFTEASGWNYYDGWGGPMQLIAAKDGSTVKIYYTVLTWDATPWAPRVQLYYSSDLGKTFNLVTVFGHGNSDQVSMWNPYGTTECYLLNQSNRLSSVNGTTVTTVATNSTLPTNTSCQLRGHRATNGTLTFYAMTDRKTVYRSNNNGTTWTLRGTTPSGAWSVGMEVSLSDPARLFYGEVNCYRSTNGGTSWNLVNEWWEYYGNVPNKLHADIMQIEFFRKSNNQEFALVPNHGGMYVSYDFLQTTQNLSLTGLNVSQYYDVRTDPTDPNYVYAGSQDQGYQRASTAGAAPYGSLPFTQVVSGDYGHMVFSSNGTHFWKQYPGGDISYHHAPKTSNDWWDSNWVMTGDDLPNVGWMLPTAEYAHAPGLNKILIGGGNLGGGSGSHLVELTASEQAPYDITATQDAYDFKPNSNNGSALISAIAVNPLNGRYYVATDDGTFFRKNQGGNWQKATGFDGPNGFYLYGSCILASKINPNKVWFSGSGYSNPPVWESNDGGLTFTAISDGLPGTLVQEIASSPDEQFLFAATDNGPYVYDVAAKKWFSLRDETMPLQTVYSVEYIASKNLVRFGTHGRGIWDFVLDNMSISGVSYPSNCGAGSGEILVKGTGGTPPLIYEWSDGRIGPWLDAVSEGIYTVTVTDANGISNTQSYTITSGGKPVKPANIALNITPCNPIMISWEGPASGTYQLRYRQGNSALWTVLGNIGQVKSYALDLDAANGTPVQVALRYVCPGTSQSAWVAVSGVLPICNTPTELVSVPTVVQKNADWRVYPNPASSYVLLSFSENVESEALVQLLDGTGRLIRSERLAAGSTEYRLDLTGVAPGVYYLSLGNGLVKKLMVG